MHIGNAKQWELICMAEYFLTFPFVQCALQKRSMRAVKACYHSTTEKPKSHNALQSFKDPVAHSF